MLLQYANVHCCKLCGFIHEFINISSVHFEITLPEMAAVNSCIPESLFNSCLFHGIHGIVLNPL